ncbi:MAG: Holliday junction branch migration protein RuvA [Chitinophagia bacterium]|nr:Holliday junction branch migration protein RuvA [Chitinophagia bacterium]
MFAFIEGAIAYRSPSLLYINVGGVGYEVHITLQTYDSLGDAPAVKLFTHLQVREDAWVLYGFATEEERATFRLLLGINGVGAATARLILSSLSAEELRRAITANDHKTLEKIKGIGAKTAQRILLELQGKEMKMPAGSSTTATAHNTASNDALIALVNLGIAKNMAENALKKIPNPESLTVEELLKQALRNL